MVSLLGAMPEENRDDSVVDLVPAPTFDAFYSREYPSMVALARVLTGSRAHAEDIAQETMLIAYRRWEQIAGMEAPYAYVRRICVNLATSHARRRLVEARALVRERGRAALPELPLVAEEFWAEVRRLPRRQAQCIALRYVYGCAVSEIAQTLHCSQGTVKMHLFRGRTALAARLGEDGAQP